MALQDDENCVPFRHVVISGCGLMGGGIATCCVQSGYKTWLLARTEEKANKARQEIETYFRKRSIKLYPDDVMKAGQWLNEKMSKLNVGTNLIQALAGADIFIEAVIENREIKQDLFAKVEELAAPGIILVTNTSSMRLIDLGSKLKHPQLLGGLHFLSPVPAMKIVEVVKSEQTSNEVAERLETFGRSLDKVTIRCKDTPGFVINRMILPLLNSSHVLLDENIATAEAIDIASKIGMNLPMGLLSLSDLIGLDTIRNANNEMMKYNVMELRTSKTLDALVEQGRLGKKSGKGFFDYTTKN